MGTHCNLHGVVVASVVCGGSGNVYIRVCVYVCVWIYVVGCACRCNVFVVLMSCIVCLCVCLCMGQGNNQKVNRKKRIGVPMNGFEPAPSCL